MRVDETAAVKLSHDGSMTWFGLRNNVTCVVEEPLPDVYVVTIARDGCMVVLDTFLNWWDTAALCESWFFLFPQPA